MRRADRLFQIVQFLRFRATATARSLAEEFDVCERTIYRDIRDLTLSGVPIEGEAGVGYTLRKGFDLPPLMFTGQEIEGLVLGARIVKSFADPGIARSADEALRKIEAVLPSAVRNKMTDTFLYAPMAQLEPKVAETQKTLRMAINEKRKVEFSYTREDGATSNRTVWPLGLFMWGKVWTMGAWCQLRGSLRSFRLDRIDNLRETGERFEPEPGRTIDDFFEQKNCRKQRDGFEPGRIL